MRACRGGCWRMPSLTGHDIDGLLKTRHAKTALAWGTLELMAGVAHGSTAERGAGIRLGCGAEVQQGL